MPKYNGVELPAPPAGWDPKVFPHACVVLLEIGYIFEVATEPMTFTNPLYSAPAGHQYMNWILTEGAWNGGSAVYTSQTGSSYSPDEVIWTNTDITDDSGKVYMAATALVYEKWKGLKRWLIGNLCKIVPGVEDTEADPEEPTPDPEKELVAHIYNGFRLPLIPENEYQYLAIGKFEGSYKGTRYIFYALEKEPWCYRSGDTDYLLETEGGRYMWSECYDGDTAWGKIYEGTSKYPIVNGNFVYLFKISPSEEDRLIYTNFDVKKNGQVVFGGSDPVPVYE